MSIDFNRYIKFANRLVAVSICSGVFHSCGSRRENSARRVGFCYGQPSQLSDAIGSFQLTDASHASFTVTTTSAGQLLKTGEVLSSTITSNEHVEVFPLLSVAV